MTGHNYPDNLYADHEEAKARRVANQAPTGAYRSTDPELSESERKLRTALAYVNHARDLIREALAIQPTSGNRPNQPEACNPAAMREAKIAYDVACDGKLQRDWPTPQRLEIERVPKWDPRWAAEQSRDGVLKDIRDYGSAFVRHTWEDGRLVVTHVPLENVYVANPTSSQPPNCDGLSARDIRSPHPMASEVIRDHDERLSGAEDRL